MGISKKIASKDFLTKKNIFVFSFATLYWIVTFFSEGLVFDTSAIKENIFTYCIIKTILYAVLLSLGIFVYKFFTGIKTKSMVFCVTLYSVLYWCIIFFWRLKTGEYPFIGDEHNIYSNAIVYQNMGGFFTYLTTYFYMIAMQLIPHAMGIVVFKVFLCGLALGYTIYRLNITFNTKWAFVLYVFFLIPPSLGLGTSIHRIPMYVMLYMFYLCKLFCDYKDGVKLDKKNFLLMCLITAVLAQWRVEGIYLVVFGAIMLFIAYRIKFSIRSASKILIVFMLIQALVYLPQAGETVFTKGNYTQHRLTHFYNYSITNMMRNGLDREKNSADLEFVNRYVSLEAIDALNNDFGDNAYADEYIVMEEEYEGIRKGTTEEDLLNYEKAMNRIILRNPLLFIKSQLGAIHYISVTSAKYNSIFNVLYSTFSNLYITFAILLCGWIWLFIKKQWLQWFAVSGILCHATITTILLPAAYFKYFYPQFMVSALLVVWLICHIVSKKNQKTPLQLSDNVSGKYAKQKQ